MSMSTLLSALRVGGRKHVTASILGARPNATGSHVFRIQRFTQVREKVANGSKVYSSLFNVGGHDWRIMFYPNGEVDNQGSLSLYLTQASHDKTGSATATFKMSILDKSGKALRIKSQSVGRQFMGGGWGWIDFIKLQDLDKEKHLQDDDCLSVLCDVTVDLGLRTDDYTTDLDSAVAKALPPQWIHKHGLTEALWKTQEPDVKIQIRDGEIFAAHRWVLEARSPAFMADLAPASSSDAVSVLRIDDMDADVCEALLHFVYTDSPPQKDNLSSSMAEQLLVAADRYKLEKLKLFCEEAVAKMMDTTSVVSILELAERHGCPVLRDACIQLLDSPDTLSHVLSSPEGFDKLKKASPSAVLELAEKKRHQLVN